MNYFIDFEAKSYTEEIISIGCIRENNDTFYTLVAPKHKRITKTISKLTNITKEQLVDAPSSTEVFEDFYHWVFDNIEEDNAPNFYVWGDGDSEFLRQTFARTKSNLARFTIGYVNTSLNDYSKIFCKKANMSHCKLINAYNLLINQDATQSHNALDDAKMLYELYTTAEMLTAEQLQRQVGTYASGLPQEDMFSDINWKDMGYPIGTICIISSQKKAMVHFDTLQEAVDWVYKHKIPLAAWDRVPREQIATGITKAYNSGKPYYQLNWRIVRK